MNFPLCLVHLYIHDVLAGQPIVVLPHMIMQLMQSMVSKVEEEMHYEIYFLLGEGIIELHEIEGYCESRPHPMSKLNSMRCDPQAAFRINPPTQV